MACGCSTGHSCGCQSPFPWAGATPAAVNHTQAVPAARRCPPRTRRIIQAKFGRLVYQCVGFAQPRTGGGGASENLSPGGKYAK